MLKINKFESCNLTNTQLVKKRCNYFSIPFLFIFIIQNPILIVFPFNGSFILICSQISPLSSALSTIPMQNHKLFQF